MDAAWVRFPPPGILVQAKTFHCNVERCSSRFHDSPAHGIRVPRFLAAAFDVPPPACNYRVDKSRGKRLRDHERPRTCGDRKRSAVANALGTSAHSMGVLARRAFPLLLARRDNDQRVFRKNETHGFPVTESRSRARTLAP